MLDEKDLLAIGQLMDQKLTKQKQEILEEVDHKLARQKQEILDEVDLRMDRKLARQKQEILDEVDLRMDRKLTQQKHEILDEADQRIDQKLAQQSETIITEATHRMKVIMDAEFRPQFNLLAEELSIIREKMVPESRIEAIEDQIDVLKASVKRINRELRELKQAQ